MLTHIDLFSGIGGFALAAQWAGFHTEVFCEIEPFCQEVIKARFGAVAEAATNGLHNIGAKGGLSQGRPFDREPSGISRPILYPDIRALDGTRFRGATLLTGGFPCQPFSVAGKRRGKADDRHLWPEMLRVIHEARPTWVIGENVSGLIRMELDQVLADLEMEGYTTRTFHIGAVAVNAPHRRMRTWIVANRVTDPTGTQRGRSTGEGVPGAGGASFGFSTVGWDTPWPEVATRLCRVDDGLPRVVDRVARLGALGNAIVPQVAYQIIQAIADIETSTP